MFTRRFQKGLEAEEGTKYCYCQYTSSIQNQNFKLL